VDATIQRKDRRIIIDLAIPTAVRIQITDRYTEDNIYASFAQHHTCSYATLQKEPACNEAVNRLHDAIARNGHYVVNMLKAGRHEAARSFRDTVADRTIVPFEDTASLTQLKNVLCPNSLQHLPRRKVPGDVNDDRIVTAALPVLQQLLHNLMMNETQETNS
jgi:hypothetical protein